MELNKKGLKERQQWLDKGYHLSDYDREEVAASTRNRCGSILGPVISFVLFRQISLRNF